MQASIIQIADSVVAELNDPSHDWSLQFTATRVYVPLHQMKELVTLCVTVVPKSLKPVLLSRGGTALYDYFIDIGVQKRIGVGPLTDAEINAACDPLMFLAEEITAGFFLTELPPIGGVKPKCIDAENLPIFHPPDLDEKKIFTSVVTLNFRMGK